MRILGLIVMLAAACGVFIACDEVPGNVAGSPTAGSEVEQTSAKSPTEGYKNLFAAVKAKNTEAIKANVTKKTQELAATVSSKNGKPIEEVFANGFTGTTFAESLPEIRDERIADTMGAIEVWNVKDKRWEDLPFMLEDGSWKLAVGDLFAATYKSPGKGRAVKEAEAANVMNANRGMKIIPMNGNVSGNFQSAPRPANANKPQ
jgi:hypothetical protein